MAAEVTSNEQRQFWAYHDKLYSAPAQASPESLTLFASEIGLDLAAFKNCLASGKYKIAVQKDIEDGVKAGVTGTPAFFINGRLPARNLSSVSWKLSKKSWRSGAKGNFQLPTAGKMQAVCRFARSW